MTDAATHYGQALYELSRDEGISRQILSELKSLDQGFSEEPAFATLLSTPSIPKPERCQILDDSFRDRVHPYVLNYLKILTERGYMRHFSGCCKVFQQCYNEDNGILVVTAVTAIALPEPLRRKLTDKLASVTGKTIDLQCVVDEDCLGGVRLDWDGKQVDGTVRRRLEDIRGILKNTVL